jgi:hypothetical protein
VESKFAFTVYDKGWPRALRKFDVFLDLLSHRLVWPIVANYMAYLGQRSIQLHRRGLLAPQRHRWYLVRAQNQNGRSCGNKQCKVSLSHAAKYFPHTIQGEDAAHSSVPGSFVRVHDRTNCPAFLASASRSLGNVSQGALFIPMNLNPDL